MDKKERTKLLIGLGIGAAAGIGTGYFIGKRNTEKRYRREVKKIRRNAYAEGFSAGQDDAVESSEKWIRENCIISDGTETAEELTAKIQEKQQHMSMKKADDETQETVSDRKASGNVTVETVSRPAPVAKDMGDEQKLTIGTATYDSMNHQVIFHGGGNSFAYPAGLFIGPDGELLDTIDIRTNIRKHEHNRARLNLIWNQMGWGSYIPELDGAVPEDANELTDEEMNSMDLTLDGEPIADDADTETLLEDEPIEKRMEKERYLDEVERYIAKPEEAPRIISRKEFSEEAYLKQINVDYYDVDNVFVESTDEDTELDAYDNFGVTNGNDLFRMQAQDDDDPDTVYIKNFRMNFVAEVTRWHKSYASIKDGSGYVKDGNTN